MTNKELADAVNANFGTDFTDSKMKSFIGNHRLYRQERVPRTVYSGLFPKGVSDFIRKNISGTGIHDLTGMVNREFGTDYSYHQIRHYCKNHGLKNGCDMRFRKGQECTNRLEKGMHYPGCEKSWFKKGNKPHNQVAVGTRVVTEDGYVKIKVAEPNHWLFEHRLVWEEENGPVPEGYVVSFKDGNRLNLDVSNLMLLTEAENAALTGLKRRTEIGEITESYLHLTRLENAIKRRSKD